MSTSSVQKEEGWDVMAIVLPLPIDVFCDLFWAVDPGTGDWALAALVEPTLT
jgi:hypothetical protein